MRLRVVGCAGSFPTSQSAASSYLVTADDAAGRTWSVLLDLGNGASGSLQQWLELCAMDLIGVSHLHADHCADLAVLAVARRYRPDGPCAPVPLWGPSGTADRLAQLAGSDDAAQSSGQFEFHTWDPAVAVQVGPLTVEPVPVQHTVETFGVRITGPSDVHPGRTVSLSYTADTDTGPGLDALAADVDLLLAEATFQEGRDDALRGVHLTGRRAGLAASHGRARALVLTHLPAWNDPDLVMAEARAVYDGPIDLAAPGHQFVL